MDFNDLFLYTTSMKPNIRERLTRFMSGTTLSYKEVGDTIVLDRDLTPLESATLLKDGAYFGVTRTPEDAMNKVWNVFTAFDLPLPPPVYTFNPIYGEYSKRV